MPKVSVYLPDDLYREARDRGLPISALTQRALREAVEASRNAAWIERARTRLEGETRSVDTTALMDAVREEFGA